MTITAQQARDIKGNNQIYQSIDASILQSSKKDINWYPLFLNSEYNYLSGQEKKEVRNHYKRNGFEVKFNLALLAYIICW